MLVTIAAVEMAFNAFFLCLILVVFIPSSFMFDSSLYRKISILLCLYCLQRFDVKIVQQKHKKLR